MKTTGNVEMERMKKFGSWLVTTEDRLRPGLDTGFMQLAGSVFDPVSYAPTFMTPVHPIVATRAYLLDKPTKLYLDPKALRLGKVMPVSKVYLTKYLIINLMIS